MFTHGAESAALFAEYEYASLIYAQRQHMLQFGLDCSLPALQAAILCTRIAWWLQRRPCRRHGHLTSTLMRYVVATRSLRNAEKSLDSA